MHTVLESASLLFDEYNRYQAAAKTGNVGFPETIQAIAAS